MPDSTLITQRKLDMTSRKKNCKTHNREEEAFHYLVPTLHNLKAEGLRPEGPRQQSVFSDVLPKLVQIDKRAMSDENQMKMTIVKFRDGYSLLWCQ